MNNHTNIAVWFEIPATDYERAVTFYQTILDVELENFEMDGLRQALFPHGKINWGQIKNAVNTQLSHMPRQLSLAGLLYLLTYSPNHHSSVSR